MSHLSPNPTFLNVPSTSGSVSASTSVSMRHALNLSTKYSSYFKFQKSVDSVLLIPDPLFLQSTTFDIFLDDISREFSNLCNIEKAMIVGIGEPNHKTQILPSNSSISILKSVADNIDIPYSALDKMGGLVDIEDGSQVGVICWILDSESFSQILLLNSQLIARHSVISKIIVFASLSNGDIENSLLSIKIPFSIIFPNHPFSFPDDAGIDSFSSIKSVYSTDSLAWLSSDNTESNEQKSPNASTRSDSISVSVQLPSQVTSLSCPVYTDTSYISPEKDYRTIIFSHPGMDSIADAICSAEPFLFRKGLILWKKFGDGWPNIVFQHPSTFADRDIVVLCDLSNVNNLFEQVSILIAFPRNFPHSMIIVTPYFAPATMERVDREGQLATAETLSTMLSTCIPITSSGPAPLVIYDIHTLGNRFYFKDHIRPRLVSGIPLLKRTLLAENLGEKIAICFPDSGAANRFSMFFSGWCTVICTKKRKGNSRVVSIKEYLNFPPKDQNHQNNISESSSNHQTTVESLEDYHIIIVDDLVQSGGTLHQCRLACMSHGAKKISCYVTHAVFPNESYKPFINGGSRSGLENFWITNTCPVIANILQDKPPFKIIDISEDLARLIKTLVGRPFLRQCASERMITNEDLWEVLE